MKLVHQKLGVTEGFNEMGFATKLYERNYAGNTEQIRVDALNFARRNGVLDRCIQLVDECMADYDLDGWTTDAWR